MRVVKPSPKTLLIALFSALAVFCIATTVLGFYLGNSASTVQNQNQQVTSQKNQAEKRANQGENFAKQVISVCNDSQNKSRKDLVSSGLCQTAGSVVKPPTQNESATARGIAGTYVKDGHLHVRYTDGTDEDKGSVTGAPGTKGKDGKPSTSITGSSINQEGILTITYSDGHQESAGKVVGPRGDKGDQGVAGRGITNIAVVNGRLVVTYTDGQVADVGPLPVGPQGERGPQGDRGAQGVPGETGPRGPAGKPASQWTETDADGSEKVCTRRSDYTDDNPTYECHYTTNAQQPSTTDTSDPPSN